MQRWLKMVKYISHSHWEPIVYTALNPEAPINDDSLAMDVPSNLMVIRSKVLEPHQLFRVITRSSSNMGPGFTATSGSSLSWIGKIAVWIRGNLFIPDARALWIKPSIRFLKKYLKHNPVDVIITTGPPHSMHLIGLGLKRKTGIKWIADFRDPWTNIDYANDLMLTKRSISKHKKLEKEVVENADAVIVVSKQMGNEFGLYKQANLHVIPNGFDEEDFSAQPIQQSKHIILTHVGTIPPNRNNPLLWDTFAKLVASRPELATSLKLVFVGNVDSAVVKSIKTSGIEHLCQFEGYVSHKKAIDFMAEASALLLLVNDSPNAQGILTGKLYEYMAAKRPILAYGPKKGNLDELLEETGSGKLFQHNDPHQVEEGLGWLINLHKTDFKAYNPEEVNNYSRKNQSLKVVKLLDHLNGR